jgi:hypothetical protein
MQASEFPVVERNLACLGVLEIEIMGPDNSPRNRVLIGASCMSINSHLSVAIAQMLTIA